jgi:hypothetical protein
MIRDEGCKTTKVFLFGDHSIADHSLAVAGIIWFNVNVPHLAGFG